MSSDKVNDLRVLLFKAWGLAYELEREFKNSGDLEAMKLFDGVGMKLNSLEVDVMTYHKQVQS